MAESRSLSRREVMSLLGGATIVIAAGCGGGSSPTAPNNPPNNPPAAGDKAGAISANHGHDVVITAAQLQAGGGLSLQFTGTATHSHSVSLTGDEVVQVRNGGRVSKGSSNDDGHSHTVTFN